MSYIKTVISKYNLAFMIIESQYTGLTNNLIVKMSKLLANTYSDTAFTKIARKMTDLDIAKGSDGYYFIRYKIN